MTLPLVFPFRCLSLFLVPLSLSRCVFVVWFSVTCPPPFISAGSRFHSLMDHELKCAVRRHPCLSFAELRARAGVASSCPQCRLPLDHLGAHVLACKGAGALDDRSSRNLVRDALLGACQEAGFRAVPEAPGLIDGLTPASARQTCSSRLRTASAPTRTRPCMRAWIAVASATSALRTCKRPFLALFGAHTTKKKAANSLIRRRL